MSLLEYLRKDLKLSAKTVFAQFPRYISFTVVILLVSMLFSTVSMLHQNHQATERAYLESRYVSNDGEVYHFQLANLTETQYVIVRQFDREQTSTNEVFKIVGGYEAAIAGTLDKRYDLDIQLQGDIDSSYDTFLARYSAELNRESENYSIIKTPLLDYELSMALNTTVYLFMLAMIVAAGAIAIWVLHRTMINHYKFTYGIYMSFGATFGRLFLTAFWEQFWIVLFTWIPASLASLLISWLVFKQTGLAFSIFWNAFLWAFLLTLISVAIAVFVSIRAASAKTPSSLIIAADNSNLISSPRVSYDLIGATFPSTIGKVTYRRYRKYIMQLMAGTLVFSMLFVSAITIADCYQRVLAMDDPEISVSFDIPNITADEGEEEVDLSQYGYDAKKRDVLAQFDGIYAISKRGYTQAMSVSSHVKIDRSIPKLFSGGVYDGGIGADSKCYLNVDYNALDSEVISSFDALGYEVEGSLESVLKDDKTVAVTVGFLGADKFDWKIGDKVLVADRPDYETRQQMSAATGGLLTADLDKLLGIWLDEVTFQYTEYTVGAIISEIPTDQNWAIYFSEDDYRSVTGHDAIYNELEIYAEPDATDEEVTFLYNELRHYADSLTNMTVVDLDTATNRAIEQNKNYTSIITMIALVLLVVCPLVWFFSQSLFYQKRQQEFELLQSMGASSSSMKGYFMGDAIRFAITGGLLFAVFAPVVSWLMHRLVGYIMVLAGDTMLASFKLPIIPYLVGILLNLVCGFVTCCQAWLSYRHKRPTIFAERGKTDEPNRQTENKEASV